MKQRTKKDHQNNKEKSNTNNTKNDIQTTRPPITPKEAKPPLWKVWWIAARPHTLTAAIAPCLVGSCWAYAHAQDAASLYLPFSWSIALRWCSFCMLVQLGTNLHNDYADFVKGADTDQRVGQARATQKGWLTPFETALGATLVLSGALVIGLQFGRQLQGAHSNGQDVDWFFTFIVASSIFNAFCYTGGPYPLGYIGLGHWSIGYSGLGDVFVFLYFGVVATAMIPYLHHQIIINPAEPSTTTATDEMLARLFRQDGYALTVACIQVGLLATNIIVVNNLRDRHTDIHAGKRTLAVRLGATFCRLQYRVQCLVPYGLVASEYYWRNQQGIPNYLVTVRLLPLLTLPLANLEIKAIEQLDGSALNSHVGKTALLQFVFCIFLGLGMVYSP